MAFSPYNDIVTIPHNDLLNFTNLTFETWLYEATSNGEYGTILFKAQNYNWEPGGEFILKPIKLLPIYIFSVLPVIRMK